MGHMRVESVDGNEAAEELARKWYVEHPDDAVRVTASFDLSDPVSRACFRRIGEDIVRIADGRDRNVVVELSESIPRSASGSGPSRQAVAQALPERMDGNCPGP